MCSVEIGHFNALQDGILVDVNEDRLTDEVLRGLVLQHPRLEELNVDDADESAVIRHLNAELVDRLNSLRSQAVRRSEQGVTGPEMSILLEDFQDPVQGTSDSKVACMPVLVPGRTGKQRDTGWVVMVPERGEQDEKPAESGEFSSL